MKLSISMYVTLRGVLIYYKKLRKELETYGFVINPYDPCVGNKWVKGSQLKIVWHVNDMKVSHVNADIGTHFTEYMKRK